MAQTETQEFLSLHMTVTECYQGSPLVLLQQGWEGDWERKMVTQNNLSDFWTSSDI